MKEYRSSHGERRLWFEENEIDHIMENEMRKARMFPSSVDPAFDVEAFLENYLKVKLDIYAPLDGDELGATYFARGRRPSVMVSKDLTRRAEADDAAVGIVGRWRATLAHEAAHVILHRNLYEQPPEQRAFRFYDDDGVDPTLMRCLERNITFRIATYDWREYQANQGMAALLMPGSLFSEVTQNIVGADYAEDLPFQIPSTDSRDFWGLLRELSCRFEVSQEAARIRLEVLGLTRDSCEPMLGGMLFNSA